MRLHFAVMLLALPAAVSAADLTVATPASLRSPVEDIARQFSSDSGVTVKVIFRNADEAAIPGPDGSIADIFIGADTAGSSELLKKKLCAGQQKSYAVGRIVLWARKDSDVDLRKNLEALLDKNNGPIAVADPKTDPVGMRTKEVLLKRGIWKKIERRLIIAADGAEAACLLKQGKARIGVIPLSVALSSDMKGSGLYYQIHDVDYQPLEQSFIVMKGSEKKSEVIAFSQYLEKRDAQKLLRRYGFSLPAMARPGGKEMATEKPKTGVQPVNAH